MNANDIHASLGAQGWRMVLVALGIAESFLQNKHGPCPACGGKDRFRFDNKRGRGDFFCNNCRAGDGFGLLMRVHSWDFAEAKKRVCEVGRVERIDPAPVAEFKPEVAQPTQRVRILIRESCAVEDCEPAKRYLASRALWPLPPGHTLRAHASAEYWHEQERIGRFPALLALVKDVRGELVTAHVTYLERSGSKLSTHEPRKILSGLTGRNGCAAQLMPAQEVLGIAEGIETAFSASKLHRMPVWAALNSSLLARFIPPRSIKHLVIFADHDLAGLDAANTLMTRLQGRVNLDVRKPSKKDWNDILKERAA